MQQYVPTSSFVFSLLVLVYWEMRQHLWLDPSAQGKEGRSPKAYCSVIDDPWSCSPQMMKGFSLHKLKTLPFAPWSERVDHISSALPNRVLQVMPQLDHELEGDCTGLFSFFWPYLRFWDLSCLQVGKIKVADNEQVFRWEGNREIRLISDVYLLVSLHWGL